MYLFRCSDSFSRDRDLRDKELPNLCGGRGLSPMVPKGWKALLQERQRMSLMLRGVLKWCSRLGFRSGGKNSPGMVVEGRLLSSERHPGSGLWRWHLGRDFSSDVDPSSS